MGEFNVNKTDGSLEQTAGMPSEYPASQVMLSDGVTSVEDALDEKLDISWRRLTSAGWDSSGDPNLSFFNIPNIGNGFAPIAKIVNSDGSFAVYGFLSDGFYKAKFNSSGVYQSNVKIG